MEEELSKEKRTLIKLGIDCPLGICDDTTCPHYQGIVVLITYVHVAKNCVYAQGKTPNWALQMCLKTVITANVLLQA